MLKMHKSVGRLVAALTQSVTAIAQALLFGPTITRARTCDIAFTYRMGAGFPGDINRVHPFSVVPGLINTTTPPRLIGDAAFVNAADNTWRGAVAGDGSATARTLDGIVVRSYPTQQSSGGMSSALGGGIAAPTTGVGDFLRQGFMMVQIPAGRTVTKGGAVFVWCAATAGANIQGGFQDAASSTNTVPVTNAKFTGPADATGIVEIEVWAA